MILLNNNLDLEVQSIQIDPQGRWIILKMLVDNKQIWLINVCRPNNDDSNFFKNITNHLLSLPRY